MSNLEMFRPAAPFYVQFEVTEACNHRCFFCYNNAMRDVAKELDTDEAKAVLDQMRTAGVFSINFNGGEPLSGWPWGRTTSTTTRWPAPASRSALPASWTR